MVTSRIKMQKSFSIVEDDDVFITDDDLLNDDAKKIDLDKIDLSDSESEENDNSPKKSNPLLTEFPKAAERKFPQVPNRELISKIPSAGPSGRQTVVRRRNDGKFREISSDSEESDNDIKGKIVIPGEYDPKQYENLEVDDDVKDIFQYIAKYIPQQLNLDYKFKPFVPEFLPAVGDIDAFLKVVPPEKTLNGDHFDDNSLQLGLVVLDEPAFNQSDPALLHLQLRATSVNPAKKNDPSMVVKKIDNVEKNSKVIDKWIKDISDLHKSKSSPVVRYSESMPDLDDLMQEWPEEMENKLREEGFPKPGEDTALSEYVETVCNIFQIPVAKNKIQSLHLLFCLFAAIKQTQLYQSASVANNEKEKQTVKKESDHLVLEM